MRKLEIVEEKEIKEGEFIQLSIESRIPIHLMLEETKNEDKKRNFLFVLL
jgi:hypothetical protein